MIAAWMLWSIGAGMLLLVAGLAAERLFEGRRRWVWVAAGAGTVLLTAVRLFSGGGTKVENPSGGLVIPEVAGPVTNGAGAWEAMEAAPGTLANASSPAFPRVTIPHDSVLHSLDGALLLAWLTLSAGLAAWALIGALRLHRRRRSWEPGTLLGQPVLWSRKTGPAIVGLRRPRVVLPSWVDEVGASQQKLILAHEDEHRRADDGLVRFAMAALTIAFPWNPVLWLHYRRLCLAIELDCDHRVVKRLPHRRWLYGDLLVQVGARDGLRPGFAPTAFAERRSFLERRIGKLLSEGPEVSMAQAAFFAFAAIMVAGVAMWAPGLSEEAAQPEELASPEVWHPADEVVFAPTMEFTNFSYFVNSYMRSKIWYSISPEEEVAFRFGYEFMQPPRPVYMYTPADAVESNEVLAFQVWENEPDAPLPVVSLPTAPSPYTAAYEVPPVPSDASVMEEPQYIGHTTRPELANRWQVRKTLEDRYPADLKDAGIGGTTVLYLFVNTDGTVSETIVKTSSGHPSLDWAAVQAAKSARFLSASNEGIPVGIWIEMEMPFVAE
ncbi:MAG: M56 family metallopeptidase [Gemmatimonadetes bacterium]|nr:M56 family metallopeptidase [Gemmatimonadota bacterium]MYH51689.1 M56 family metallopeptidase [Gemmatimonadota bacterium]MYK65506.1 M56 family metallopeptidase [Gemmatimonadota bacterium]